MLELLHPRLQRLLLAHGWTGLTPAQVASIDTLLARRNALILAPTGYGKTEAAILPILHQLLVERDRLADQPWPEGFKAIYVTPLRALNRDLVRRLESWCQALELKIGVRHGDTSQAERARQARKPPDILITTPESLQLLLYGDTLRRHLGLVRFVVLDEVHDMATSERGAQLMVALERVEEVVAQPAALREAKARDRVCPRRPSGSGRFQRIGLSATVSDAQAVARFMGGGNAVEVIRVHEEKKKHLSVVHPDVTDEDVGAGAQWALSPVAAAQVRAVRGLALRYERVLVFLNTRDGAEVLASRSALLDDGPPLLGLHHGSLSADHRIDVETQFRDGAIRGLVATSSLELGIDIGAIDHVIQVQSPRSVARLVQRLGRAGHNVGRTSECTLISSGPEDHLECVAVARMAQAGALEPLRIRDSPLVVLANQLVALSNEYRDLDPDWCQQVITRAAPFAELDEGLFQACWDTLIDVRTLQESEPGRIARTGRARKHFLGHLSLIPDEKTYRVIDEASKRAVGTVDDAYVAAAMQPGEHVVMAGRSWRVLEIDAEGRRVRVAPARELGAIPQWGGQQLPVSYELAQEVARLRGEIAAGTQDPDLVAAAAPVLEHVAQGLAVASHTRITLDAGRGTVVANVALGTRGNEALGRLTAALIHQRAGAPCGMESDAYRIHFTVPHGVGPDDIEQTWRGLDPGTLDLLLGMVLRDQGVVRHHLVHVAKHFGALPPELDPNRFTRAKMDALWDRLALQEETLSRLMHDRFDLQAVAGFLQALDAGALEIIHQGMGPLSHASSETRRLMPPRRDDQLLEQVRRRIEQSDVMLVCTQCRSRLDTTVADVPRNVRCRRCSSQLVACLRPWEEDKLPALGDPGKLDVDGRKVRKRLLRNAQTMAGFGSVAARCLAARGVGPDTAARILQKSSDPESPQFWREVLQAELEFARTNAYWAQQ